MSAHGRRGELLTPQLDAEEKRRAAEAHGSPRAPWRQLQQAYGNQALQQLFGGARGGQPLADPTRGRMEAAFSENLQDVRVHTGVEGEAATAPLGAGAVTVGRDIYLAPTSRPDSIASDHLLAHELAHVVQQGRGGSEPPGPAHEAEADRAAEAVRQGKPGRVTRGSARGVPQGGPNAPTILTTPTVSVPTASGTTTDVPYDIFDVSQVPADQDALRMQVRNRAFAAKIANPSLTEDAILKLRPEQLPTEVTVGQLKTYARATGLKTNVLIARSGGGSQLVGYDTYRVGEVQPGEPTYFKGSAREGYVESAPKTGGVGKNLMVRRIMDALEADAKTMFVEVGSYNETISFHERLSKAAGLKVNVEPGKGYWLDTEAMANVMSEWGEAALTEGQRDALRQLVATAQKMGKRIPPQALRAILQDPTVRVGTPGEGGPGGAGAGEGGAPKEGGAAEGGVKEGGGPAESAGPKEAGEGGGGGRLAGKLLTAAGIIFTAKHLIEAWGTDEFGITVVQEGMIWGSALTPLGPLGPPLMSFMFWYGDKFGQALATLLEALPRALEALGTAGAYTRAFVTSFFFRQTLVLYQGLNPENWDYRSMSKEIARPVSELGPALWAQLSKMDVNAFREAMLRPLSSFNLPASAMTAYSKATLTPAPILEMTPIQLFSSLKSNKLRFVQDPEFAADYDINVDEPELDKGEETRIRDLVEIRTMLDPDNWDLSDLPNLDTKEHDKETILLLGTTLWAQLQDLDRTEFQRMSLMGLSSFGLSPDLLNQAAATLARVSFPWVEMSPEMVEDRRASMLNMTPQELLGFLRGLCKLRFKQDPKLSANEAIMKVKAGYQPW